MKTSRSREVPEFSLFCDCNGFINTEDDFQFFYQIGSKSSQPYSADSTKPHCVKNDSKQAELNAELINCHRIHDKTRYNHAENAITNQAHQRQVFSHSVASSLEKIFSFHCSIPFCCQT